MGLHGQLPGRVLVHVDRLGGHFRIRADLSCSFHNHGLVSLQAASDHAQPIRPNRSDAPVSELQSKLAPIPAITAHKTVGDFIEFTGHLKGQEERATDPRLIQGDQRTI